MKIGASAPAASRFDAVLAEIADLLVDRIADRVAAKIAAPAPVRVTRENAKQHGVSWRTISEMSRRDEISIRGVRPHRYVDAGELVRALEKRSSTPRPVAHADAPADTVIDLCDLARRRAS